MKFERAVAVTDDERRALARVAELTNAREIGVVVTTRDGRTAMLVNEATPAVDIVMWAVSLMNEARRRERAARIVIVPGGEA